MKISKSRYEANKRYNSKSYERLAIDLKVGNRDKLKLYCASIDKSVNQYVKDAINAQLVADGADITID